MIKRNRYLPYFLQTPERQEREKEIAKRAIRMACEKADYSVKMCSYATLEIQGLSWGCNPRAIIKDLKRQVEESIEYPNYKPSPLDLPGKVTLEIDFGNPAYSSREFRKKRVQQLLNFV